MQLEHQFSVPVPVAQAWDVLLDVERIAPCMPGATVESFDGETIVGRVKVKVGPIQVTYSGTARFTDKDEAARRAVIEASAKEARGSGTATATITAAAAGRRRLGDQRDGHDRPGHHRQAGAVRPRRDGGGGQQAARPVRRLPGRHAGQRRRHRLVERGSGGRAGPGSGSDRQRQRRRRSPRPPPSPRPPSARRPRQPAPRRRPPRCGDRSRTRRSTCSTRRGCRCSSGPPRSSSAWWCSSCSGDSSGGADPLPGVR